MNDLIEVSDEEQFTKCQKSRDLQVYYDAGDVETRWKRSIVPTTSFAFSMFQREG
jgi:hypothetical protein